MNRIIRCLFSTVIFAALLSMPEFYRISFNIHLLPHSYTVFAAEK